MKSFTIQPFLQDVTNQLEAINKILKTTDALSKLSEKLNEHDKDKLKISIDRLNEISDNLLGSAESTSRYIKQVFT